jgi:hypothetical protein
MLTNKRKIRLCALPSIVCLQAGPPGQTLRARRIFRPSALEELENQPGFLRSPACSDGKSALRRMDEMIGF